MGTDLEEQIVGASGATDHLVPGVLQEGCDAFPQERTVVRDDDSQTSLYRHEASIKVAIMREEA